MATGKKQILLAVYEILRQYSDEGHPLSIGQVGDMLAGVYGICAERKAISRNIRLLKAWGYDLHLHGEEGQDGYYLRNRPFSDDQLRILMEGVLSYPYIPTQQAHAIARRLANLSTVHFYSRLEQISRPERSQGVGELIPNLERLEEAIEKRRKVCFRYLAYGLDGALHLQGDQMVCVSPYELASAGGHYVLMAAEDGSDDVRRYRVDRMAAVQLLEHQAQQRKTLPGEWTAPRHPRPAVLRLDRSQMDDAVEAFGENISMRPMGEQRLVCTVDMPLETVANWVLCHDGEVEVLEPQELKALLFQRAQRIIQRLSEDHGSEK